MTAKNTKHSQQNEFRLWDSRGPTDYVALRPLTKKQRELVERARESDKVRVL